MEFSYLCSIDNRTIKRKILANEFVPLSILISNGTGNF